MGNMCLLTLLVETLPIRNSGLGFYFSIYVVILTLHT